MLQSPFREVRRRGLIALRALGEDPEPPIEPRDVRFSIVVDGRPFASRAVIWQVKGRSGNSQSSRVTSDESGAVEITRDLFVDKAQPVAVVALESPLGDPQADVWFKVEPTVPSDLDEIVGMRVETQRLTIRRAPDAASVDSKLRIYLTSREDGSSREDADFITVDRTLDGTQPLTLRLQRGRVYQVTAFDSDDQYWLSEEVTLGAEPAEIVLRAPERQLPNRL
jgi:hypothetical protein